MNEYCRGSITVSRIRDYTEIYPCIKKGLESWHDLKLNSKSMVAIKPNLCCIKPFETGATTDPRVVEGIIRCLKDDYGVRSIFIIESDGSQVLADMAFKLLGYEKLSEKYNVTLMNLSRAPFVFKHVPENVFLKKIRYPQFMEKVDFIVSVPKIKKWGPTSFTVTLKNQFGCNPYARKDRLHKKLDDAIVDLNMVFKPDLIVVDGIIAMGGYRGPVDGVPIRMNTIILGRDPVAVDHLVARMMGINPYSIRYFVEAEKRGLGTTKYSITGPVPWEFRDKFRIDPPRLRNLYNIFRHDD